MNDADTPSPESTPPPKPAATPPPRTIPRDNQAPLFAAPAGSTPQAQESQAVKQLRAAYKPLEGPANPLGTTDGLLKNPMCIAYELIEGRSGKVSWQLWGLALLGLAAYGLVMGMFSGGAQFWAVPLKLVGGTLFSALICLPSLYIFAGLSGAEIQFKGILGLVAGAIGLEALLLIGFAPVSWVFTVSTESIGFMGFLHFLIWIVAMLFGLRFIYNGLRLQKNVRGDVMFVWFCIFILVSLQMSTTLRPLLGEFEPGIFAEEKRFFLQHWFGELGGL